MKGYSHSIRLEADKCRGCTNCIKTCPTEAIRVRGGKAKIIDNRCIDCGECIRVCPHQAKKANTDEFETIFNYKYKIALPAPSLYAQFSKIYTRGQILAALKLLGFDYVYEVARAAELITAETKEYLKRKDIIRPVISSACPVVVRLIRLKYPSLIPNISQIESPMEAAAEIARNEFAAKTGARPEEIGIFFISPCAAKHTAAKMPIGNLKSNVDGVIAIKSIYVKLLKLLSDSEEADFKVMASKYGVRWANSGGESLALETDNFIAVDGIHNVAKILEEIEDDKINDVDFIEALACNGGCLGGPLCMENVYSAKAIFKKVLEKDISQSALPYTDERFNPMHDAEIEYVDAYSLDKDMYAAINKMAEMNRIVAELPGLDCGACGAPNCRALAEDIIRGEASESDCIIKLKEEYKKLKKKIGAEKGNEK